MKKATLFVFTVTLMVFTTQVNAQENIKKEIKLEDVNGIKTLTIETVENGRKNTEIYKGDEADKKMRELDKAKTGTTKTIVIDKDGKQKMKIEKRVVVREEEEMN